MFVPNSNEKLIGKPVQVQAIWDDQFACVCFVVGYPGDSSPMLHTDGRVEAFDEAIAKVAECLDYQVRNSPLPTRD